MKNNAKNIKILIGMAILLILMVFGLSKFNESISNDLETLTRDALIELAVQQQSSFDSELGRQRNELESITQAMIHFYNGSDEVLLEYTNSVKDNLNFENVMLVDNNGIGILSSGEKIDISQQPYFTSALTGEVTTSVPHNSPFSSREVITVANPISYEGRIQAVIAAEYSIDYLNTLLQSSINDEGFAVVVDDNDEVLLSTYAGDAQEFINIGTPQESYDTGDTTKEATSYVTTLLIGNEMHMAVYRPLEYNNWTVVYIVPQAVVTEHADSINNNMLLIGIITVVVFCAFMLYIMYAEQKNVRTIKKIAYYDELTGLRNLAKFKLDVTQVLTKDTNGTYCVLKGDVDNFKAINEMFSFEMGDKVLKTIAEASNYITEPSFMMAHVYADQFLMFAKYEFFEDMEKTSTMYESMFRDLITGLKEHHVKFRLGRYKIEKGETDIDAIISKVNMAHSYCKTQQSGVYRDYDEKFKQYLLKTTEITNKMQTALLAQEFQVYLQPKVEVANGTTTGAEALVRWIERDGNMIFPNDFIPLFESNGFIVELDKYMLGRVCRYQKEWMDKGRVCVPISVNFSRLNLKNSNFATEIKELVNGYGVPANLIEIEVTETTVSENETEFRALFGELTEAGFAVSIDDFGSGYSSLGMLKNFDIRILKLDKSFFESSANNRGDIVVEGVVNMANSLSMYTVAEGIETQQQVELLKNVGCDSAQGYFYAKPMPAESFESFLLGETAE